MFISENHLVGCSWQIHKLQLSGLSWSCMQHQFNDNITLVFSLVLHGACEFVGKRYSIPMYSWTMKKMTDLRSEDITYTLSTFHSDPFKHLPILLPDKYRTLHVLSNCLNCFKVLSYYFNCKVFIFLSYWSHDMNSSLIVIIFCETSLL